MRRVSGLSVLFGLLLLGGAAFWLLYESDAAGGPAADVLRADPAAGAARATESLVTGPRDVPQDLRDDVQPMVAAVAGTGAEEMPASYRRALGALTGRVLTADLQPVPGLPIELLGGRRSLIMRSTSAFLKPDGLAFDPVAGRTVTDAEGRFRMADLQPRTVGLLLLDPGGPRALLWPLEQSPVSGQSRDLGDIVLPATATLRGRIVDEHDRPVAGARVRSSEFEQLGLAPPDIVHLGANSGVVFQEGGPDRSFAWVPPPEAGNLISRLPVPTTYSDADGSFELTGVLPGFVTLAVDELEHLGLLKGGIVTGPAGGVRDIGTLMLGEGVTVRGRVLDGKGQGVPGAEVLLGNPLGIAPGAILRGPFVTDEKGAYEARGYRPGALWAIARPDARHEWTIVSDLDTSVEGVIRLPAARTLTLAVLDPDGAPLAEVEFFGRAIPDDDIPDLIVRPHALPEPTRDERGLYVIGGLKADEWEIVVKAPGRPPAREEFDLREGDASGEVRLQEGHALTVRVVAPDGSPVEWASVEASRENDLDELPLVVGRTGADGRVRLPDMPAEHLFVTACHPAWAVAQVEARWEPPAEDAPPREREVLVTLQPGGRLVGKVIDGAGPPAEPLLVIMMPEEAPGDAMLPRGTLTDLEGTFAFDNVEAGEVHVQARSRTNFTGGLSLFEAFFDSPLAEESVQVVAPGETSVLLDVGAQYADMETGLLRGHLTVNGLPGDGWRVRTWGRIRRTVTTDARGDFDLGRVEAGTLQVSFSAPGSQLMEGFADRREVELLAGERKLLDVTLSTGAIAGRVVSALHGRPLPDARVHAVTEGDEGWDGMTAAVTDVDGRFRIEPAAAGTYRMRVRAEGHANFTSEPFELRELQERDDLVLRVPAAIRVAGHVSLEGAEREAEWLWLVATGADGHSRDTTRVRNEDHVFEFDGLAPGEWTFSLATDLDQEFEPVKVTIDGDESDLRLDFKLAPPPDPEPQGADLEVFGSPVDDD